MSLALQSFEVFAAVKSFANLNAETAERDDVDCRTEIHHCTYTYIIYVKHSNVQMRIINCMTAGLTVRVKRLFVERSRLTKTGDARKYFVTLRYELEARTLT